MGAEGPLLEDRFASAYAVPVLDEKQDKVLVEATVLPSLPLTSFVFTMPVSALIVLMSETQARDGSEVVAVVLTAAP